MQRDEAQKRVTLPSVLGKNQRRLPGGGDVQAEAWKTWKSQPGKGKRLKKLQGVKDQLGWQVQGTNKDLREQERGWGDGPESEGLMSWPELGPHSGDSRRQMEYFEQKTEAFQKGHPGQSMESKLSMRHWRKWGQRDTGV